MPGSVPEGWERVRLGDVAAVGTGGTPSRKRGEFWCGDVPWMASGEIHQRRVLSTAELITALGLKHSNAKVYPAETVMVAMNGQGRTRGMTAILGIEAACNQSLAAIRGENRTEQRFLFHVLDQSYERLRNLTGDGRSGLNLELIRQFDFLLPPIEEQRAIAAVLDAVDGAIERTEAVIAATEELRRALLHELLTRGVPGWHSEWNHVPGLGTVPACWKVTTLGEVCERPEYGAGAPAIAYDPLLPRYVRITDLTDDGRLRADEPRSADPVETAGYELEPGDLLFARSGATVGKTYLYRHEDGPCVYAGYLIRFRAKSESVNPDFLELWTRSAFYERWVASMFRAGAQPNINATEYASLPLVIPNPGEQDKIVGVLAAIRERLDASRGSLTRLARAKAGLSDALLSGRVRIRQGVPG